MNTDNLQKFKARSLSWSSVSSFEWDREKWYKKYILGEKEEDTARLLFGKTIGERLASDFTFLPEVPRLPVFEKRLTGKVGDIQLVGYLDAFQDNPMAFLEYKTSSNSARWNQEKADAHGQMLFYYFLIWLMYAIPPEKVKSWLVYIPCRENGSFEIELSGDPAQVFPVKKTATDVLKFGAYLTKTHKEMCDFVEKHI